MVWHHYIEDASPQALEIFFAQGGIVYDGDGCPSYFDKRTKKYICKRDHTYVFDTLEQLACFVAFFGNGTNDDRDSRT
jgi:hypothetical protein